MDMPLSILKVSIRQIKAARALLAWSQEQMAEQSSVSVPTVKRLESSDGPIGGRPETIGKIVAALESGGVEFTNGSQPGVRMRGEAGSARAVIAKGAEARGKAKTAVDEALAKVDAGHEEKASRKRRLTSVAKELKQATDTIATDDLNASNDE
jgi:transcriptional regulator with XRE-family HTH domain